MLIILSGLCSSSHSEIERFNVGTRTMLRIVAGFKSERFKEALFRETDRQVMSTINNLLSNRE